jgi:hypothetical protein
VTQRTGDRRLFTIRNLAVSESGLARELAETYEFEVYCEAPAHGEFSSGPLSLLPWDAEPVPAGSRRSLLLTITDHLQDDPGSPNSTKAGFYHGISMPAEFCTLATVMLRRRIGLGPLVRAHGLPLRVSPSVRRRHNQLIYGSIKLGDLVGGIDLLRRLPDEHHEMFILACRMYQEALALIDEKPDLAYLLLVSSVEVFVAKLGRKTVEGDLAPEIRSALADVGNEAAKKVLLDRVLDLDRGIGRNFVSYVVELVSDEFWQQSPSISIEDGRVDRAELPDLLRKIYNQRSKTLHEAEPFPPNIMDPPDSEAEIDRRPSVAVGQRRWTQAQVIPYVTFFERLVQHVLLQFLLRNGRASFAEAGNGDSAVEK